MREDLLWFGEQSDKHPSLAEEHEDWSLMPFVTVVIPYGGGRFLRQAVESVLEQTHQNFELIIVDDCSKERAANVIKDLEDSRVKIIRLEQKSGISKALNLGIAEASGELIARMDADDISLRHRFALQCQFMIDHPEVVICGSAVQTTGLHSRLLRMPLSDIGCRLMLLDSSCFAHPSVIFRRKAAINAGLYDCVFDGAEDYEFWCRLSRFGKMANLPMPLLKYRQHGGQITRLNSNLSVALRKQVSAQYVARQAERFWPGFRTGAQLVLHAVGRACSLVHKAGTRLLGSAFLGGHCEHRDR